jgi:subtilisin-like proprotein convertase family protein
MNRITRKLIRRAAIGALVVSLGGPACIAPVDGGKGESGVLADGKEDAWDWRNDPRRFDHDLNYHITDLPREGRAERVAWPSTYWPTYEDSINHRWQRDTFSPAEKYDRAFNGWTPEEGFMELRPFSRSRPEPEQGWDPAYYERLGPLASHVSRNMGNRRDRELAIEHGGAPEGDVEWKVETWWGLCHAWVPASILEERPERAVTYNGVTFEVGDMEALLIAAYNRSSASMIGGRCNLGNDEESEIERDEHGRAKNVECRDTNPGSFHVIMSNFLGLQHRAYAEDRTYDYQVWNQPVVAFEVTKMEEIDVAQANQLLTVSPGTDEDGQENPPPTEYLFNEEAHQLFEVHANTTYVSESYASTTPADASRYERRDYYTYILEVDEEGKIIGGEWFGRSRTNQPDFLWSPRQISRSSVPNLDIDDVRMLVRMSREPEVPNDPDAVIEVLGAAGVAIPDDEPAGAVSVANVDASASIGSVQVDLAISHTYAGDLTVTLKHGDVERVLSNREGGSSDDIRRTFNVPGFSGLDAAGEWTLEVVDSARMDTGTIEGWTLRITPEGEDDPGDGGGDTDGGTFAGAGAIAIPDDDEGGITSTAEVPAGTTGSTVQVALNISHTYIGDLVVNLRSPTGAEWMLFDREGGSADDINRSVVLDPAPTGELGGTWTLAVSDRAGRDVGTLESWSLVVR